LRPSRPDGRKKRAEFGAILDTLKGSESWLKIGILIIEDDEANQSALRQLLDSEGWHVRVVPVVSQALGELASGEWSW